MKAGLNLDHYQERFFGWTPIPTIRISAFDLWFPTDRGSSLLHPWSVSFYGAFANLLNCTVGVCPKAGV